MHDILQYDLPVILMEATKCEKC